MKLKNPFLLVFMLVMLMFNINAQQWSGSTNNSGEIYRTGRAGVGLVNPPNDTQLYVKSGLKVGIVSEVNHLIDYQFGMLSAVNRPNTKALSVLLKNSSGEYEDKFAVMGDGRVFANEVEVRVPIFPDYVFEPTYNLMSLHDLELYILENKHLPNIPPAKKIVEEGLSIGEMQVKQMEKIEELTLYVIELNKKIEKLEAENKELKGEITPN